MKIPRSVVPIALLVLAVAAPARAQESPLVGKHIRVVRADGKRVSGHLVESKPDGLFLRNGNDTHYVPREDLKKVENLEEEWQLIAARRRKATTADDHFACAADLKKLGFDVTEVLDRVLELDPDHEGAHRARGHERHRNEDGKLEWFSRTSGRRLEARAGQWFLVKRTAAGGAVTFAYQTIVAVEAGRATVKEQPADAQGKITGPLADPPARREGLKADLHCTVTEDKPVLVDGESYLCDTLTVGLGADPKKKQELIETVSATRFVPHLGAVKIETFEPATGKRWSWELVAWGPSGGGERKVGEAARAN